MFKKIIALLLVLAMSMVFLPACGSSVKKATNKDYAQTLYDAKNPYISNLSANGSLIRLLRLNSYGKYTIEVQDKEKPYSLSIRYMFLNNGVDETEFASTMAYSGILLLALIDDCEQVNWNYPSVEGQKTGSIGIDYANELLGTDVKADAKNVDDFSGLCYRLFPSRAPQ